MCKRTKRGNEESFPSLRKDLGADRYIVHLLPLLLAFHSNYTGHLLTLAPGKVFSYSSTKAVNLALLLPAIAHLNEGEGMP